MAILELTLVPIGTGSTSVSGYVAEASKILKESGIKHELNPMGTVLEGNPDELFKVVRDMQEKVFDTGAKRVYTVIKMDDRRDKEGHMEEKIKSVNDKLN